MPNSPDNSPLDYFYWTYLKRRINKRKVRTIGGLKKAIREEVKNTPQSVINKWVKSLASKVSPNLLDIEKLK